VLTALLPGLREIRAPLISGYLWLVFFFLAFHGVLPTHQSADPTLKPLFDLGRDLSALGIATVTGVAAYLVGSAAQEVLKLIATVPPGSPLYAEAGTHLSSTGKADVGSAVRLRVQAIQRSLYQVALSPGEKGVDGEPSSKAVEGDLPLIRTLLLGEYPDLVAELDRLQAEADLRITVAVPIVALVVLFCFEVSPFWLLALILAGGLLAQGYKRQVEVGDLLAKALRIGKVDAPTLQSLDASAAAAIERTVLEEDLARKVKEEGSGMAAFRLGNLQASGGDFEGAVMSLRVAVENNVIRAYAEIGFVYQELELFDEAEQAYRDGKKRRDRRATERLANLLREQNREEEALQAEKPAGEVGPAAGGPPPSGKDRSEAERISDYEARIQAGDAKAAINLGLLRQRKRETSAAVDAFEEATRLNKKDPQAWLSFGRALRWADRPVAAIDALEKARDMLVLDLGPDHLEVADAASELGAAMSEAGDFQGALSLLEDALRIQEAELGPDAFEVATTIESISTAVSGLGDESRSRELDERSLRLYENALGGEDPRIALSLRNLAISARQMGDYMGGKDMLERGLRILEGHPEEAARESAYVFDSLGTAWDTVGEYSTALELHRRALRLVEEDLGSPQPLLSCLHVTAAGSLLGLGRSTQALEILQGGVSALEDAFGPKDPMLGSGLLAFAMALLENDRVDDAVVAAERAVEIAAPSHRHLLFKARYNLGAALSKRGELESAGRVLEEALDLGTELFGEGHLYLAPVYIRLGVVRAGTNELNESVELFQRGQAIVGSAPFLHRPLAGIAAHGHAAALLRLDQLDAAEVEARSSISVLESAFGKIHPEIATALDVLASILEVRDPEQANAARARADEIRSKPEDEQGAGGIPAANGDQ
jgi:tetratricopeptide (TPR) repeat protein